MTNVALPQEYWDQEVASLNDPPTEFLWGRFVAKRNITLLSSQWKSGKTTLIANLLAKRRTGGTLAGFEVRAGKTIVITEEPRELWAERLRRLDFGGQVCLMPRPFSHIPEPHEWEALLERIGQLQAERGVDLLVIDPLAHFLRTENHSRGILDLLLPLRALTARGMAVLIPHHPRKGVPLLGQAARGHGSLMGHVDIYIEMRRPGGSPTTRIRRFFSFSRHAETPPYFAFEMNAEGTDYTPIVDDGEDDCQNHWDVLRMVLEDAPQKLTRQDILDEWPPDFEAPNPATLWKLLARAVNDGLITREGTGRKADPFRYYFLETEERWKREQPFYEIFEQQRRQLKLPFTSLRQHNQNWAETEKKLGPIHDPRPRGIMPVKETAEEERRAEEEEREQRRTTNDTDATDEESEE